MSARNSERCNHRIDFISAGAGSGKTYSLTGKLEQLLASGEVSPGGVMATTFTRLAAGELRERVRCKLIEAGQLALANQMEQALIGTVNSVCGELLGRFAFEAGMPPDQQVLDQVQGDSLFYEAMEQALAENTLLMRQMNATCHRLQIIDQEQQLSWRAEVKSIADAARANNQDADDIRELGDGCADQLLEYFPNPHGKDLDRQLLNAIEEALNGIDTAADRTKTTRDYLSLISGIRAALYKERATWPEWITLSKKMPGARSRSFAEPVAAVAMNYARHPGLHRDIRFFASQVFEIAAASLDAYRRLKTGKGLIDFVDQEQRLYQLLDNPNVREVLAEELQLLMVDEFQDTSPIQLALFLKLSELADRVIWVGDLKQSIYGFRGADPTLMTAVVQSVMAAGKPPEILRHSWRSTPELVAYTNNLFLSAFGGSLEPSQVTLAPARKSVTSEPAVERWDLPGKNKGERAQALASGISELLAGGRTVIDKRSEQARAADFGDIAVLCRTHDNLDEIAAALAAARIPLRYQRPGLLATPEGCLALACLRRLIDPLDTLASAEILTLTDCVSPESWVTDRIDFLHDPDNRAHEWLENDSQGVIAHLKACRHRLTFLTPLEVLGLAIEAGRVRDSVSRWGPTEQRARHRLNNLGALLDHAREYQTQCASQSQPATSAGLVLWLYQLARAGTDTQAGGSTENAVQLVTHHGAKGLEWPIVIAMDLDAKLKPRLWGLNVLAGKKGVELDDPLAGRRLRYWPTFTGRQSANIPLLDEINASAEGVAALEKEIEESKRLLYVSLTRPRDTLILAMNNGAAGGEWMNTLAAPWMLPVGDTLDLPDGTTVPSRNLELTAGEVDATAPDYQPLSLAPGKGEQDILPLRVSPSALPPLATARLGATVRLGARLEINGEFDPTLMGSAIHAVIATTILGQDAAGRILQDFGVEQAISVESARACAHRLLTALAERFKPLRYECEYPIHYTTDNGQSVSGWIDLLAETGEGYVLIDHKASPRAQSEWGEIALGYSGQLEAYASGITRITGKPVIGRWIHFAVTGGLVEIL
jgi:ATP-dependent exoDNAse (exonuclease V) beta subunit